MRSLNCDPGDSSAQIRRIAVVGAGASATLLLHYLSKVVAARQSIRIQISVFDERVPFGAGYAYQEDDAQQLFNGPVRAGSMLYDDPGDLWRWLMETAKTRPDLIPENLHIGPNAYLPRWLYGRYLNDRFAQAVDRLRGAGCSVGMFNQGIADVRREGRNRYTLRTETGALHVVSSVVFCTGNSPHLDHYGLSGNPGYVGMPYPTTDALASISPDARVGVLGTQLTGTDVAIALCERGHRGSIVLFSRSSELPVIRSQVSDYRLRYITNDALSSLRLRHPRGASLRSVLRLMRRELLVGGDDWRWLFFGGAFKRGVLDYFKTSLANIMQPSHWQSVLIAMDEVVEECWSVLSRTEKKRFLNRFDRVWLSRRAPIPAPNAYKLYSYLATGRIRYQPGVTGVTVDSTGRFVVTHGQSTSSTQQPAITASDVDVLVNATGPARDIDFERANPYACLIAQGLVVRDSLGGIRCDFESSGLIDTEGNTSDELYAIGHMTSGTYYFVASILMHSKHAKRVAAALLSEHRPRGDVLRHVAMTA